MLKMIILFQTKMLIDKMITLFLTKMLQMIIAKIVTHFQTKNLCPISDQDFGPNWSKSDTLFEAKMLKNYPLFHSKLDKDYITAREDVHPLLITVETLLSGGGGGGGGEYIREVKEIGYDLRK